MDNYTFTKEENELIEKCLVKGHKSWGDACLSKLKTRLKEYLIKNQDEICCYCYRNISGEFLMVLDIEHILPKSKYSEFMFNLNNLAISCKRCNMEIKRNRIDFIKDINEILNAPFDSNSYLFIHPTIDEYREHIKYVSAQVNEHKLVFYTIINDSEKGEFSVNFFKLNEFSIDSFNSAQGIEVKNLIKNELAEIISDGIKELSKKNDKNYK